MWRSFINTVKFLGDIRVGFGCAISVISLFLFFDIGRFGQQNGAAQHSIGGGGRGAAGHAVTADSAQSLDFFYIRKLGKCCAGRQKKGRAKQ